MGHALHIYKPPFKSFVAFVAHTMPARSSGGLSQLACKPCLLPAGLPLAPRSNAMLALLASLLHHCEPWWLARVQRQGQGRKRGAIRGGQRSKAWPHHA